MGLFYDAMTGDFKNTEQEVRNLVRENLSLKDRVKELERKFDFVIEYISDFDDEFGELEAVLDTHENSIEELQHAAVLLLEEELDVSEIERKVWSVDVGNCTPEEVKVEVERTMSENLPPKEEDWLKKLNDYWLRGVEPAGL